MSAITKRQQARNEKELNELLRQPGNNVCADCQARNPGWASWSLGIFLCMRCASIHRKLGTHISKVKSLTMDTWTGEQVQSMRDNGNIVANKTYNPRNKRPDIPLDADEVDSAMERYIRKKYQEKSLSDGKPLPPARNDPDTRYQRPEADIQYSRSPETSPPPPLPPKKGKFFGFGLRAVSSAYSLSKHDKKNKSSQIEPRVDHTFRIGSESYSTPSRAAGGSRMSEEDLQKHLITLREMGFQDTQRSTALLRATNGDVERTIATLIKMDKKEAKSATTTQASATGGSTAISSNNTFPSESDVARSQTLQVSTNPFDQISSGPNSAQGLSLPPTQQAQPTGRSYQSEPQAVQSNNPFDVPVRSQTDQGLLQAFQGMQVSQPLFPHSTGGHPVQPQFQHDTRLQYSMSPPVPVIPQQYGYTASPTSTTSSNPFFQSSLLAQMPNSNPYPSGQQQQTPAQSMNPIFSQVPSFAQPQPILQSQQGSTYNPFGIPPQPQAQQTQQTSQSQSIFDYPQQPAQLPQQQQSSIFDFPQQGPFQSAQIAQPPLQQMHQTQSNPYFQLQQQQSNTHQSQSPTQYQTQFQGQPQALMPQQTGRYDKSSILALYNYPQLAPQPALASIPEPSESQSPTPSGEITSQKRSATMPVSSMYSAGGGGSRNPFLSGTSSGSTPSTPQMPNGARHASAESVQINNLQSGRHSPDAFANLSAGYMR